MKKKTKWLLIALGRENGYILRDGADIEKCKVDKIRDVQKLNERIAEKMK